MVAAIAHFESVKDFVSRDLVTDILEDTEEHIDFLETELELVQKVGLQNYLQTQIGEGPSFLIGIALLRRHQVAFAAGDGLVEDLAHRIDAGAALRCRALAAEHLLAAGGAGAGGGADLVVADAVANADDHGRPAR